MQQPFSGCIPNVLIRSSLHRAGNDPDPFGFDNLFYITRQEDSKKLNDHKKPCVIISASGMMEAGRVKHHLANNISAILKTLSWLSDIVHQSPSEHELSEEIKRSPYMEIYMR